MSLALLFRLGIKWQWNHTIYTHIW